MGHSHDHGHGHHHHTNNKKALMLSFFYHFWLYDRGNNWRIINE